MNNHKRTRLTLLDRQEIWRAMSNPAVEDSAVGGAFPRQLSNDLCVVLKRAPDLQEFTSRDSTKQQFKTLQYGLKHEAKRYNKFYPGELVHFDTKRLPFLKGQSARNPREYLFVAIDDFSREL